MMDHIEANLIRFADVGGGVLLGILVAAFMLALRGLRAPYLRPSPGGFALRRPWEMCAVLALMGFASTLAPPLPLLQACSSDRRSHEDARRDFWPHLCGMEGLGLAGATLFLWAGSPQELAVDEERRTYRRSTGWPPFRRACIGPLSDLEGVWAEEHSSGSSCICLVYVGWRIGPRRLVRLVVGRFWSEAGAEYYADELAAVMGVPRLVPGACWLRPPPTDRQVIAGCVGFKEGEPRPPSVRLR